ncbi:MAG TPA: hypothetical protein PL086_10950, partial [Candidatus Aminicenantes bacterium]|nr:hypothetical protein [Candidatus Aminicenantes bacterium]
MINPKLPFGVKVGRIRRGPAEAMSSARFPPPGEAALPARKRRAGTTAAPPFSEKGEELSRR